ncbi:MAG: hypothetical protein H6696_19620 [Deferribacteres bacterium]|nr:hypothetical protein [Deferribacteres bacterium]
MFLKSIVTIFDRLEALSEGQKTWRIVASGLVLIFLATLGVIELNRHGLLPGSITSWIPQNHFYAVHLAFTLLLLIEIIGLVFALSHSVSDSVGKQFEIFSLILLRNAFKQFVYFDEPIQWLQISEPIYHILSDAAGAILIFFGLGLYYRLQKHNPITSDAQEQGQFIAAKKLLALLLLVVFAATGIYYNIHYILTGQEFNFFGTFYTILIFADILLVLISIRYCTTYQVVFRNSGFAVITVVIRLALVAPPYYSIALGICAMLFALGLTMSYNSFTYGLQLHSGKPIHHGMKSKDNN